MPAIMRDHATVGGSVNESLSTFRRNDHIGRAENVQSRSCIALREEFCPFVIIRLETGDSNAEFTR